MLRQFEGHFCNVPHRELAIYYRKVVVDSCYQPMDILDIIGTSTSGCQLSRIPCSMPAADYCRVVVVTSSFKSNIR